MNHDDRKPQQGDGPIIPEPTSFEQAEKDGIAERIASGDTEGGADQFMPKSDSEAREGSDKSEGDASEAGQRPTGGGEGSSF